MGRVRDYLVLLTLVGMGTGLGMWRRQCATEGAGDPVTGVVRSVVVPVQGSVAGVSSALGDFIWGVTHARQLKNENERLRARLRADASRDVPLRELSAENARLRRMVNFPPPAPDRWIAATVVGEYPEHGTLTIACGSRRGVKRGAAVMTSDGLVGQVCAVDANSAQVRLLTAEGANVGARIERSRSVGVCQGSAAETLALNYLKAGSDVREGDLVLTSGLSANYPKGLVIGRVARTWLDSVYNVRRAIVKPGAKLDDVEEVFVRR